MLISRRGFLVLGAAAALSGCSNAAGIVPAGVTSPAGLSQGTIMAAINGTRKEHGIAPLRYSGTLESLARTHVRLMAARNTLSHEIGGTLRERVDAAGYHGAVGENLADGHKTLESAIGGWLRSDGHRRTLLNPRFSEFGLAAATSKKGRVYWAFEAGGSFDAWKVPDPIL